jgi:hypothetical protein
MSDQATRLACCVAPFLLAITITQARLDGVLEDETRAAQLKVAALRQATALKTGAALAFQVRPHLCYTTSMGSWLYILTPKV